MSKDGPLSRELEKRWLALSIFDRSFLLSDLGINGENREFLACKTIDEVVRSEPKDLPSEVKSRLVMAMTAEGFSKDEYERAKKGPERGN
jgi:hypothetical protein